MDLITLHIRCQECGCAFYAAASPLPPECVRCLGTDVTFGPCSPVLHRVFNAAHQDYGVSALQEVGGGLQGLLAPHHTPSRLGPWRMSELGYFAYVRPSTGLRAVSLTPNRTAARPIDGWRVQAALLAATIASTLYAGGSFTEGLPPGVDFGPRGSCAAGFSVSVLFILISHELGHWFAGRRNGIRVTLPFLIPVPFMFGTMGAFIQMRSPPPDRDAMIRMGAAGPLAGLVATIIVLACALPLSAAAPAMPAQDDTITFGEPLLLRWMTACLGPDVPAGFTLVAHPAVFAGWFGLLITSLNLLPGGQLDGGHVLRAYLGHRAQKRLTLALSIALLIMGWRYWAGWYLWAAIVFVFGFIGNPGASDEAPPPSRAAHVMAALTLLTLIVSFCPWPVTESVP